MIRPAAPSDIPSCVRVITASFQTVADEFHITRENAPRFTAFATDENRLLYQMHVEKRPMFVYVLDDIIVGYVSLSLSETTCEINNLSVLPEYRRMGIGGKLLDYSKTQAKNAGRRTLTLSLVDENTRLKAWYRQKGFIQTHTAKYDFFPFTCAYMEMDL